MSGAPPHLDLFDYKPELVKRNGQDCPDAFLKGKRFAFTSGMPKLLGTPRNSRSTARAASGCPTRCRSLHDVADELCVIKSMYTDQFNHAPAELLLFTGSPRSGRPSMGSWVTYGLGSENENLPGFVVLISSGVQPERRPELLGQRLPPVGLPGRAVPLARATRSCTSPTRPAWTGRCAAAASTRCAT